MNKYKLTLLLGAIVASGLTYANPVRGFAGRTPNQYLVVVDILEGAAPDTSANVIGREFGTLQESITASRDQLRSDTRYRAHLSQYYHDVNAFATSTEGSDMMVSVSKNTGAINSMSGKHLFGYYLNSLRGLHPLGDSEHTCYKTSHPILGKDSHINFEKDYQKVVFSVPTRTDLGSTYSLVSTNWQEKSWGVEQYKVWVAGPLRKAASKLVSIDTEGSLISEDFYGRGKALFVTPQDTNDAEFIGGIYYVQGVDTAIPNTALCDAFKSDLTKHSRIGDAIGPGYNVRISIVRKDFVFNESAGEALQVPKVLDYMRKSSVMLNLYQREEIREYQQQQMHQYHLSRHAHQQAWLQQQGVQHAHGQYLAYPSHYPAPQHLQGQYPVQGPYHGQTQYPLPMPQHGLESNPSTPDHTISENGTDEKKDKEKEKEKEKGSGGSDEENEDVSIEWTDLGGQ